MTSTVKPKAKFSSRNLSAVYKAPSPSLKPADNAGGFHASANRMLVIGRPTACSAAAPAPLNTPSLRKEHYQASAPTGSPARTGWAVPTAVTPLHLHGDAPPPTDSPGRAAGGRAAGSASPAQTEQHSTQSPSEHGNVWASGHVAEVINPALAHHHVDHHVDHPAATALPGRSESAGRATGRFARSPLMASSGRWGDDAVEQDIERWDHEQEMRRHREFPDLKEAAQLLAPHHEELQHGHQGGAPYAESRRFAMDRPAPRFGHFERGFHREDDHRTPYPPYHGDRFGRDDGYGRFDGPRRFEAPVGAGGAHSRFSPSDARFDGFDSRHEGVGRALPSVGGGSSRAGSSHGSVTSASDLDVSHRYPSPPHYSFLPEDAHHHHHHHQDAVERSPSLSERSAAPVPPSRPVEQAHPHPGGLRAPLVEREAASDGSNMHDEPFSWRQRPGVASATPPAGREVGRVEGAEQERKNSSRSRASSSSSAGKPTATSASVQAAVGSPQVRILKRVVATSSGPKMLFDPKTGGMVSAEKQEPPAPGSRRRKADQVQQTVEKRPSADADRSSAAAESPPKASEEATMKVVATLMVGDMELPIHDVLPGSFGVYAAREIDEQPASEATVELKSDAVDASGPVVEVTSFEVRRDDRKTKSRRRETKSNKTPGSDKMPARPKPEVRALERVTADEHRSRSESTDRKKSSRREDTKQARRRDRDVDGPDKMTERRGTPPRSGEAKREPRVVEAVEKPSTRPARRANNGEGRGGRQQTAAVAKAKEGDKAADQGFQTARSRRVVLSEKRRQQRQQEPRAVEDETAADTKTGTKADSKVDTKGVAKVDGSTQRRRPKGRRVEHEAESKGKSDAPTATEGRGSRRTERQAGGEQASEKPQVQPARSSRGRGDNQQSSERKPAATGDAQTAQRTPRPPRGKRSGDKRADKRRPSGDTAKSAPVASRSERGPGDSAASTAATGGAASTTAAKPAGKAKEGKAEQGQPQRKSSARKVYVAKAPTSAALSAA